MTKKWDPPWRVLVRGAVTDGWAAIRREERFTVVMDEFREIHRRWLEAGARLIGTIDDNLLQAGTPGERFYGWYELYEVDRLELVGEMLDLIRQSQLGTIQLDTYIRYDALIGPPVVELEKMFGLMSPEALEYRPRPEQPSEQPTG